MPNASVKTPTPLERLKEYFIKKAVGLQNEYEITNTDGHPGSTGNRRENLVIDFFNAHLPERYSAYKGGKVFDTNGKQSEQIDLIIYDKNTPRLGKETETLFLVEGVASAIEIKPTLDSVELPKAFKKITSFKKVTKSISVSMSVGQLNTKVYSGIFAFDSIYSLSEVLEKTNEFYKDKEPDFCVDFICVNNKFLIIKNDGSWEHKADDGIVTKVEDRFIPFLTNELSLYKCLMILCKQIYSLYLGSPDFTKYINLFKFFG